MNGIALFPFLVAFAYALLTNLWARDMANGSNMYLTASIDVHYAHTLQSVAAPIRVESLACPLEWPKLSG